MPYCTIDEAWQQSLNPELQNHNTDKHTSPLSYDNTLCDYSELYALQKPPLKKPKRMKNKSRTYNRLPNHNGPSSRLPNNQYHVIKDDLIQQPPTAEHTPTTEGYDSSESESIPINMNHPSNEFNVSAFDNLNQDYTNQSKDLKSTSSIMEDFKENIDTRPSLENGSNLNQYTSIVHDLQEDNQKLRKIIIELKQSKPNDTNSFMELIMFISTGVVVILMMENINSLVRKF
jgi:hypothetical protein